MFSYQLIIYRIKEITIFNKNNAKKIFSKLAKTYPRKLWSDTKSSIWFSFLSLHSGTVPSNSWCYLSCFRDNGILIASITWHWKSHRWWPEGLLRKLKSHLPSNYFPILQYFFLNRFFCASEHSYISFFFLFRPNTLISLHFQYPWALFHHFHLLDDTAILSSQYHSWIHSRTDPLFEITKWFHWWKSKINKKNKAALVFAEEKVITYNYRPKPTPLTRLWTLLGQETHLEHTKLQRWDDAINCLIFWTTDPHIND